MRLVIFLALCVLARGQDTAQAVSDVPPRPPSTPEDLQRGGRLFKAYCAYCHGTTGEGGRGANLTKTKLRHAPTDAALFKVIGGGIPGTEMPPGDLSPRDTWQLVTYVRSLARVSKSSISGDIKHGQALYESKGGCTGCHTISGRGGAIGPDLTDIGAGKGVEYLRAALLNPDADVPEGFLQVRLVAKDGKRVTGVRLNEDAFSIQIRDLSGAFHSYWKDELQELNKDFGKSPMPNYRQTFTPGELDDVLAYLESLQGN